MQGMRTKSLTAILGVIAIFAGMTDAAMAGPNAKPVITSANTKSCTVGLACSYQITATNTPTSYGASPLATGLGVNTATGLISGTPTTVSTVITNVTATNAGGTSTPLAVTFTIKPPAPVITSASSVTSCNYQITATNSPTSFGTTSLPAGCTVDTSTGLVSGTATTGGTYPVTVSATNAGGTGSSPVTFTIPQPAKIVVAPSGGNFTTITAALNAITPSASTPYTIEVWPGNYAENVVMKSYVHLKGLGREVTSIKYPLGGYGITATNLTKVEISGLSISGSTTAIRLTNTSATITGNDLSNNGYAGLEIYSGSSALVTGNNINANRFNGIDSNNSSPTITGNILTGNGSGTLNGDAAIYFDNTGIPIVSGNVITGNNANGIDIWGTENYTITDNIISDNTLYGLKDTNIDTVGVITHNKIVNNGGTLYTDIFIGDNMAATTGPNVSFNIYDDITGTRGVGAYNLTFSGNPAPAP